MSCLYDAQGSFLQTVYKYILSYLTLFYLILFELITPCLIPIFVTVEEVIPCADCQHVVFKLQRGLLCLTFIEMFCFSLLENVSSGGIFFC